MSNDDAAAQAALQIQQAQINLKLAQAELEDARREVARDRHLIIALGERFVPEVFARLATGAGPDAVKLTDAEIQIFQRNLDAFVALAKHLTQTRPVHRTLSSLSVPEIAAVIGDALEAKLVKLLAFTVGLTAEQRELVVQKILAGDHTEWINDPRFVEAQHQVEAAQQAQREAEQAAREANERASRMATQQAENAREVLRLREEIKTLQAQLSRSSQLALPNVPVAASDISQTVARPTRTTTASLDPTTPVPNPPAQAVAMPFRQTPADPMMALIFVMATRGLCERDRIAEVLRREFDADDDLTLSNAFKNAMESIPPLVERKTPRDESGSGRLADLMRLTPHGVAYAREQWRVEPVPQKLDRLLQAHDTLEHVGLILQARNLFLEKYPEPVADMELFPAPIALAGGKRSEPDLVVTLQSGERLLIECERNTSKDADKRKDKWDKYYEATRGEFCVVCPDARAVQALMSEVNLWHLKHQGHVHLRIASIAQARVPHAPFWTERTLGK